jgi:hypothetical protein
MAKETVRVYKSGGIWVVKRTGATRAAGNFYTQKEAYMKAREIALNRGLTITVYYPTGGIQKVITPKEKGASDEGCFITTACVKYYGMKDNCYQLETLRNFRDNYLLLNTNDQAIVKKYYRIAPIIVDFLNKHPNKDNLYKEIFNKINEACLLIENKKNEKAKILYSQVVFSLINYFGIK